MYKFSIGLFLILVLGAVYALAAPSISYVSPDTGPAEGGIPIEISGIGFEQTGTTQVLFGGTSATNVHVLGGGYSAAYVTCILPAHAPGSVDVMVINPDGQNDTKAAAFTYLGNVPPVISYLSPDTGPAAGGIPIEIFGTGFLTTGTTQVLFGGTSAMNVQVLGNGYGSLYVSCILPAHAPGTVDVTVINPDGESDTKDAAFTYDGGEGEEEGEGEVEGEGEDECNPDETPPVLLCADITIELDSMGLANLFSASALYTTPAITKLEDVCEGSWDTNPEAFLIEADRETFDCTDLGTAIPVVITAADSSGNITDCTLLVTVQDPLQVCPGDCDDNNACTIDRWYPGEGCVYTDVDCDDGIACTVDDCVPDSGCSNTPDDTLCDDGDVCNGSETCDADLGCVNGTPLDCDDGVACTVDACDAITGCSNTPDDTLCDDGDVCNGSETCDAERGCVDGTPLDCDDGVPCTVDACDAVTGCSNTPDDTLCDDGDVCNGIETCDADLGCVNGTPLDCDDGVACTVDACDPSEGCSNTPNDALCDDGDACNGIETCDAERGCVDGTPPDCDDGVACTVDSCDPVLGCEHVPDDAVCADDDICTTDTCSPILGCQYTPLDCNDGVDCTVDSCEPAVGCVHTPDDMRCDDSDACTTDNCDPATGCEHTLVDCDDGIDCSIDSCDPDSGCIHTPDDALCDDNNLCTTDRCDAASGCTYTSVDCDDGNSDTEDYCDPATGECVHALYHPADLNQDWRIVISEAIGYLSGWQQGTNPIGYAIRGAFLWQNGEAYTYNGSLDPPLCWELAQGG